MSEVKRILVLSDNVGTDYISRIESGAKRSAATPGFSITGENLHQTRRSVTDVLDDGDLAGIILTAPLSDDRHVLLELEKRKIPFVRVAPMLDLERGICVLLDEYEAARAVTEHMISKGHRRIAIIKGPRSHLVSMRRYNGFVFALGAAKIGVDSALIAEGDFSRESGREVARQLLRAKPTAVFSSNDEMAVGFIDAAKAAKIAIPQEISIAGYDDNPIARQVRPQLTSVRQPLERMGDTACTHMIDRLRNPHKPIENTVLNLTVVERDSVAPVMADKAQRVA